MLIHLSQVKFRFLKSGILLLFLFISIFSFAEPVVIKGNAIGYENKVISIYKTLNYLSLDKELVQSVETNDSGYFEFTFDLAHSSLMEIISMRNVGQLLVSPGKKLEIEFLLPAEKALKKFADTPVGINIIKESGEQSNIYLRKFLDAYDDFIELNAFYIFKDLSSGNDYQESRKENLVRTGLGIKANSEEEIDIEEQGNFKSEVQKFVDKINQDFLSLDEVDDFIKEYIDYTCGSLMVIGGYSARSIYSKYIEGIEFTNPAMAELFRTFYGDLFAQRTEKNGPYIKDLVNKSVEFKPLDSLIKTKAFFKDDYLRHVLFVDQIQENFFTPGMNKNAMFDYLKYLENDASTFVRSFSTSVQAKLLKGKEGYEVENFKLLNEKNEFVTLEELKGKFVYIGFYAHWCRNCEEELMLIENLKKEYGRQIEFVSICMDDNYSDYKNYLAKNKKQDWHFLFGASDPKIADKFGLKSLPTYYLLDPEGKIYYEYTKSPTEGIQRDFAKIMIDLKKKDYQSPERIKVWDD